MENKFELFEDLTECHDSMLFDSGTQIATYGTEDNYVSLEVQGEVRVDYDGATYRHASDMPDELLEKFKGDWYLDEDIFVDMNNWFDYVHILNGDVQYDDVVFEGGLQNYTKQELEDEMSDMLDEFNSYQSN